jgi:hypothetical protein
VKGSAKTNSRVNGYACNNKGTVGNAVLYAVCANGLYNKNASLAGVGVVGGDGNGSLESETVKYGHESQETNTRK